MPQTAVRDIRTGTQKGDTMFDQILFTRMNLQGESHAAVLPDPEDVGRDDIEIWQRLLDVIPPDRTQFYMDGYFDSLPLFPVSSLTESHYCYLQSFSIGYSGEKYYTKREGSDSYMILYTYEGQGSLEYGGSRYLLTPGYGFFIDCQKPQYYKTEGSFWKHLDMHLRGPVIDPLYREYSGAHAPLFYEAPDGPLQDLLEKTAALCDVAQPYRDVQISALLYQIAVHLLTLPSARSMGSGSITENIRYLIRYMEKHYRENLSLDFLSRFSGISKYYLSREFHRYTGFPPNEYLIRLRINSAKSLLTGTDWSIQRVAEAVGIPNTEHFTKLFHRICGVSPSAFRKSR